MKVLERNVSRRWLLVGGGAAAVGWISRPFFRRASAQTAQGNIAAVQVAQVPTEPDDAAWDGAGVAPISLFPQNIVLPRLKEAGAKSVNVRALYDADRVAFLLEWRDAHKDADLGTVLQYRDAVAIQFPEDPAQSIPSVTMGQKDNGVVIYHWKSDWQFGRLHDVDDAYPNMVGDWYPFSGVEAGKMPEATDYLTKGQKAYLTAAAVGNALADPLVQEKVGPVQKMRAEGFGTIEPHPTQDAKGKGVWRDSAWRIVISVPRKQTKFTFTEGTPVSLALAVWDGSRNERNGRKAFSFWNSVSMGVPSAGGGAGLLGPLLGSVGGVVVVTLAVLVGLRFRKSQQRRTER